MKIMAEPFTEADVELVARTIRGKDSGTWEEWRTEAEAVLTLLLAVGRLLPPGVVLTEQFGHLTSTGDVQRCLGGVCGTVPDRRRWVTDGTWEVIDDTA